ncbi:GtrA family protein [uncultured Sulfitobacter sp.]|uniref:GtrA family protein n=1 Tax=uncultured Sulfitobacter sp. TaxID=191468 RepID=UPI0026378699|nr:GtrA family protein [uncultured Sulfitobacter sp.]
MAGTSPTSPTRTELSRALRFALIGGAATLVHLGVAMAALGLGAGAFASNAVGFAVAFVAGLVGHFHFTFGLSGGFARAARRYGVIACAGFAVNNGVLATLKTAGAIPEPVALALSILVVPAGTFLAARFWGFVSSG